jgi:hypothetical protein
MSTTSAAAEDWIHLELMVEHHHDSGDPNLRGEATRRCLEQTAGLAGDAQQCASLRQPAAPVETRRSSTAKWHGFSIVSLATDMSSPNAPEHRRPLKRNLP